jgi:hypothetical protein
MGARVMKTRDWTAYRYRFRIKTPAGSRDTVHTGHTRDEAALPALGHRARPQTQKRESHDQTDPQ